MVKKLKGCWLSPLLWGRRGWLSLMALLMSFQSLSGQTQLGYIKTKGRLNLNGSVTAGQSLSGAVVTTMNGNDVMSDADGRFSMKLSSPHFVLKNVTKKNYALCDPDLLKKQYDYSTNDLVIVMEDELEKANERKKIERQVRNSLYAQTEKEREEINRLKQENAITEEKYRELLQQVNKKEDDNETIIKDMVEKYSQIDFDQEDNFSRQFSAFLLNGETMRADSLLRTKGNIMDDLNKFKAFQDANAQKRAEQAARDEAENRSRKELADRCSKYFELFKTQHKNDSALFYIEQKANLDTLNADWQYEAGYFCHCQNLFQQAEFYYSRALEIRRRLAKDNPQGSERKLAWSLNSMAMLCYITQRYDDSEALQKESLEIYRRLVKDNPQAYEGDMALVLQNLSALYHMTQRIEEAETTQNEALEIYRRLAKDNPKEYEPDYSLALNNMGSLYFDTGQYAKAEPIYIEALEIHKRLAKDNPQDYQPELARSLSNLAIQYAVGEQYDKAEPMFVQALEIRRQLAKDNPLAYEPDVAKSLGYMAQFYCAVEQLDEAEKIYNQALEIYRRLVKENPLVYEQSLAFLLYNMAEVYAKTQRTDRVESLLREALQIFQKLAQNNPKLYEKHIEQIKAALEE